VISDVDAVVALLTREAPYTPLGGWYSPDADPHAKTRPLWFQNDWVHDTYAAEGSDIFLHHSGYIEATKEFYGATIVEPHSVYVNHMMAIEAAGPAHTDNTRFAGRDRANTPMWLLRVMFWSGLFEREAITQATAIWWLNDVDGGALRYWPDGPDAPAVEHHGAMANTALLGDNHGMFHQVCAVGPVGSEPLRVTPTAELTPTGDDATTWVVTDHGQEAFRAPLEEIRVSVLWKADVFLDEAHRHRLRNEPLSLDDVAQRLQADLADRGIDQAVQPERFDEPGYGTQIQRHYPDPKPVDVLASVFDR
jgi:hypothetical protein